MQGGGLRRYRYAHEEAKAEQAGKRQAQFVETGGSQSRLLSLTNDSEITSRWLLLFFLACQDEEEP